jgi:hypothetical protein
MGRGAGFGAIDRLPSGRYRARYVGPDGRRCFKIFGIVKADARAWLAAQQTDLIRKGWRAPEVGRRSVGEYAEDYLARRDLREGTRALYASLWRHHLAEAWGAVPIDEVTPPPCAPGMSRRAERPARRPWPSLTGSSSQSST